jgi:hypothetical protein
VARGEAETLGGAVRVRRHEVGFVGCFAHQSIRLVRPTRRLGATSQQLTRKLANLQSKSLASRRLGNDWMTSRQLNTITTVTTNHFIPK